MASTPEGRLLTRRHRAAQLALRATVLREIQQLWGTVEPTALARTVEPWAVASATLVVERNRRSSTVASRYVQQLRSVEGVAGSVMISLPPPPERRVAVEVLRGAAISGIVNARRRGLSPQAAAMNGLVKASGSASSLTLAGGRDTIMDSVSSDRRAVGWMRVTSGDPCAFCAMVASRGPIYKEDSVDFETHDHCACEPEPVYDGSAFTDRSQWPETSRQLRDTWDEVASDAEDPLNAFRRAIESRAAA